MIFYKTVRLVFVVIVVWVFILLFKLVPVLAQTQTVQSNTSTYAPLTLDETEYVSLRNYLNQQPYMFAAPVIELLQRAENKAMVAQSIARHDAEKAAEKDKPKVDNEQAPK